MTYPLVLMVQTSPQARTPQSAPHIERRHCGNIIYSGPALSQILIDGGYITLDSSGNPSYHFYVQDHQGNNRLVLSASGGVEEVNSYYPYGGLMSMSTASTQRFKYNGKELNQHSYMMWYDYGTRQSAPLLGRFTSMDQLCESFCERCWQYCCRVYCRNQWHAMDSLKINDYVLWDESLKDTLWIDLIECTK